MLGALFQYRALVHCCVCLTLAAAVHTGFLPCLRCGPWPSRLACCLCCTGASYTSLLLLSVCVKLPFLRCRLSPACCVTIPLLLLVLLQVSSITIQADVLQLLRQVPLCCTTDDVRLFVSLILSANERHVASLC